MSAQKIALAILTEVVKIVPAMIRVIGKLQSAAIIVASTVTKATSKIRSEVVIIASTMLRTAIKIFSQSIIIAPVFAKVITSFRTFLEVIKVVPTMLSGGSVQKVLSETIRVADDMLVGFIKVFTERVVVNAIGIRTMIVVISNSIIVVPEFIRGALQKMLVETIVITSVFSRIITRVFTEVVKIVANATKSSPKIFTEVVKIVGALSPFVAGKTLLQSIIIRPKLRLVLNGLQVGLWAKIRRISTGAWTKISRHE